jgi:hypothetical protein
MPKKVFDFYPTKSPEEKNPYQKHCEILPVAPFRVWGKIQAIF